MLSFKRIQKAFNLFPVRNFASATPTTPPGSIIGNRERVNVFVPNDVGVLARVLSVFHHNKVPLTQVSTKLLNIEPDNSQEAYFALDFEGSRTDPNAIRALKELNFFARAYIDDEVPEVPWFPVHYSDLDRIGKVMDVSNQTGGKDHPGFNDPVYRQRRDQIAKISTNYKMGNPIPTFDYNEDENKTWERIWNRLRPLQEKIMCKQFNQNIKKLEEAGIYRPDRIPQLEDINQFLIKTTGFRLKPVSGILTQREFLNALALRTFCCTQYIRHYSAPEYTPEPDIIHELLGHAPMFADPDFADLSQQIGILSLGNNEENIIKLAALYWYTVEFGCCKEDGDIKGYGAGVASSIGEIENVGKRGAEFRPLNPFKELKLDYPIQTLQPIYYVAEDFKSAGDILVKYGEFLPKPFRAYFNRRTNTVEVDRKVKLVEIDEKPVDF